MVPHNMGLDLLFSYFKASEIIILDATQEAHHKHTQAQGAFRPIPQRPAQGKKGLEYKKIERLVQWDPRFKTF